MTPKRTDGKLKTPLNKSNVEGRVMPTFVFAESNLCAARYAKAVGMKYIYLSTAEKLRGRLSPHVVVLDCATKRKDYDDVWDMIHARKAIVTHDELDKWV